MTTPPATDVAIVGAGVIGMSTALFLQREGHRVTVVDRVDPGRSCSYGNAAGIAITEVVPISKPGLMMRVPGWLLDPSGPLSIRPYYFPKLLPWLLRFLAQGRMDRVKALAGAAAALSRNVIDDFDTLLKLAGAQHLVHGECCATIFDDEAEYTKSEWEWRLRAEHGFPCRKISGAEMHELEPDVSDRIGCAVIMDGWRNLTDPYRFVAMMAEQFERAGGKLIRGEVRSLEVSDGRVRSLRLGDGSGRRRGRGRGRGRRMVPQAGGPARQQGAARGGPGVQQDHAQYRHLARAPARLRDRRPRGHADGAGIADRRGGRTGRCRRAAGLPALGAPGGEGEEDSARFGGYQRRIMDGGEPGLPDFVPVISVSPHIPNVYYGFGHGHLGLTWGPTTGRILADMISAKSPKIDLHPYRVDRF